MTSDERGATLWDLIRSSFVWIFFVLLTAVLLVCLLPFVLFRISTVIHAVAHFWGRCLLFLAGAKVTVEGAEKLHRKGPVIVLVNHQSMFDIPVLYTGVRIQFRWMAKHTLFRIPFVGWAMSAAGYIPVNRTNKKKSLDSLFAAGKRIQKGKSVVVFPEGTRGHPDGTMLPFKKGGFILAKKANVALQPVTLWGANMIMPVSKHFLVQRVFPGHVTVVIHDPVLPEAYEHLDADELSAKIRAILESPMARLRSGQKLD